jgi:hypothetical protein
MDFRGRWISAELTDDRGYGHPVVQLQGERMVRGTTEVVFIRPVAGTNQDLLDLAHLAGYEVQHAETT